MIEGKNLQIKQLQEQMHQVEMQRKAEEGKEPMIQIQLIQERRLRKYYQGILI